MAKKQRVRIGNSRPRHNWDPDTIENKAGPGSAGGGSEGCVSPPGQGNGVRTIEGVSKAFIENKSFKLESSGKYP